MFSRAEVAVLPFPGLRETTRPSEPTAEELLNKAYQAELTDAVNALLPVAHEMLEAGGEITDSSLVAPFAKDIERLVAYRLIADEIKRQSPDHGRDLFGVGLHDIQARTAILDQAGFSVGMQALTERAMDTLHTLTDTRGASITDQLNFEERVVDGFVTSLTDRLWTLNSQRPDQTQHIGQLIRQAAAATNNADERIVNKRVNELVRAIASLSLESRADHEPLSRRIASATVENETLHWSNVCRVLRSRSLSEQVDMFLVASGTFGDTTDKKLLSREKRARSWNYGLAQSAGQSPEEFKKTVFQWHEAVAKLFKGNPGDLADWLALSDRERTALTVMAISSELGADAEVLRLLEMPDAVSALRRIAYTSAAHRFNSWGEALFVARQIGDVSINLAIQRLSPLNRTKIRQSAQRLADTALQPGSGGRKQQEGGGGRNSRRNTVIHTLAIGSIILTACGGAATPDTQHTPPGVTTTDPTPVPSATAFETLPPATFNVLQHAALTDASGYFAQSGIAVEGCDIELNGPLYTALQSEGDLDTFKDLAQSVVSAVIKPGVAGMGLEKFVCLTDPQNPAVYFVDSMGKILIPTQEGYMIPGELVDGKLRAIPDVNPTPVPYPETAPAFVPAAGGEMPAIFLEGGWLYEPYSADIDNFKQTLTAQEGVEVFNASDTQLVMREAGEFRWGNVFFANKEHTAVWLPQYDDGTFADRPDRQDASRSWHWQRVELPPGVVGNRMIGVFVPLSEVPQVLLVDDTKAGADGSPMTAWFNAVRGKWVSPDGQGIKPPPDLNTAGVAEAHGLPPDTYTSAPDAHDPTLRLWYNSSNTLVAMEATPGDLKTATDVAKGLGIESTDGLYLKNDVFNLFLLDNIKGLKAIYDARVWQNIQPLFDQMTDYNFLAVNLKGAGIQLGALRSEYQTNELNTWGVSVRVYADPMVIAGTSGISEKTVLIVWLQNYDRKQPENSIAGYYYLVREVRTTAGNKYLMQANQNDPTMTALFEEAIQEGRVVAGRSFPNPQDGIDDLLSHRGSPEDLRDFLEEYYKAYADVYAQLEAHQQVTGPVLVASVWSDPKGPKIFTTR